MPNLDIQSTTARVPAHALLLSLISLGIPVVSSSVFPDWTTDEPGMLIWLLGLIPAFLLSYYRGWRGASLALAFSMAGFSIAQAVATSIGARTPDPAVMVGGVAVLLVVCLGSGLVSELFHRSLRRSRDLALTDTGTGLANRRHVMLHLNRAFAAAERGARLCVIMFDLDHFKRINDRYGHQVGDEVLRQFAALLKTHTRVMNLAGRLGGEEFISVLEDVDSAGAERFATRVREEFARVTSGSAWGQITVSAGAVEYEDGMVSPEVLIAAADQALYRAKARGRNCSVLLARTGRKENPTVMGDRARTLPNESGNGERILVVDDDPGVLRLLLKTLKLNGYNPLGAANPEQALGIARGLSEPLDLLVVDIIMPGLSGFRLAEMIAAHQRSIRVLYISGYERDDVDWSGVPGAAKAFLAKPITIERLLETVRATLVAPVDAGDFASGAPAEAQADASEKLRTLLVAQSALLEEAYTEMVFRLGWATEYRDDETGEHAQRVGRLAGRLAAEIGLSDDESSMIERAAALHDVGKIAVPDAILHKPGPLTSLERQVMETHCVAGARILAGSRCSFVQCAESIALHHHERWDGCGYPSRVAGNAIPLAARITAVADAYDALTHERYYRHRISSAAAVKRLSADGGTHFDPGVIGALLELAQRGELTDIDGVDVIANSAQLA